MVHGTIYRTKAARVRKHADTTDVRTVLSLSVRTVKTKKPRR